MLIFWPKLNDKVSKKAFYSTWTSSRLVVTGSWCSIDSRDGNGTDGRRLDVWTVLQLHWTVSASVQLHRTVSLPVHAQIRHVSLRFETKIVSIAIIPVVLIVERSGRVVPTGRVASDWCGVRLVSTALCNVHSTVKIVYVFNTSKSKCLVPKISWTISTNTSMTLEYLDVIWLYWQVIKTVLAFDWQVKMGNLPLPVLNNINRAIRLFYWKHLTMSIFCKYLQLR